MLIQIIKFIVVISMLVASSGCTSTLPQPGKVEVVLPNHDSSYAVVK